MSLFHFWNYDANRQLDAVRNEAPLANRWNSVHLEGSLDYRLSLKAHTSGDNKKANLVIGTRWGETAQAHTEKLDPVLNDSCHCTAGCLKPTSVNSLYVLRQLFR